MKAKKNAIVCVSNDLVTDNRVAKTCAVLKELDYEVILLGRKRKKSPEMPNRSYNTRRMSLVLLEIRKKNIRKFKFK